MKTRIYFLFGVVLICASKSNSYQCDRTPEHAAKPANKVNVDRYVIEISGDPRGYVPEKNYTITLRSNPALRTEYRFYKFVLVAESEYPSSIYHGRLAGDFYLLDPRLTIFSFKCPNTVIETNTFTKTNISVLWKAPPTGSGCVSIKATVYENGDNWFMDDGALTQILCEDSGENEDIQPKIQEQCCACNEAKYEVAFQGLWSRNTHPKDFPYDIFKTKLGDIIGASHKYDKSFWKYGEQASAGLKLLAEEGDTSLLEDELKEMSDDIRTIIKARELSNPTTGTSYTVCRVDQDNHLISLVSKITPSPDWIVGVANLELCLENCSWAERRTLNLYPWDIGTDNGETYTSGDSPVNEPQPILRIGPDVPNWEQSPFYEKDGEPIKPIAKLHLTRQKLYEKECKERQEPEPVTNPPRHNCEFGEWSQWSSCSVSCGKGVKTRDRPLLRLKHYKQCSRNPEVIKEMQETQECDTEILCENKSENTEDNCINSEWGPWTECSVSCGTGKKTRYREQIEEDNEENDDYEDTNDEEENENRCSKYKEEVECFMPPCPFNDMKPEEQIIDQSPDGEVIDCQVSKWSIWGPCDTSQPCKKRYKVKERHIIVHPQNGGKACPRKLHKKKKCGCKKVHFVEQTNPTSIVNTESNEESQDCVMGAWSEWSPCSTTCGYAVQQRTRNIVDFPKGNGKPCGPRLEQKLCPLPLACTGKSAMSEFYGK